MNREQIRSQSKESLLELINNVNLTEEQKQEAVNAMVAMTDIGEREAAAEMLLEAKGFTDVVVSITDGNADVVLDMEEVTDEKRAEIEDIVKRKTNVEAQNIVITPIQGNAGTETSEVDYASEVKLNREQIRAQNKASLLELINNENITAEAGSC